MLQPLFGTVSNVRFRQEGDILHVDYDYRPVQTLNYIELNCMVSRSKRVPWRIELKRRKRARYWRT